MFLPRSLLVVAMIFAGGLANAEPTVGVGISFIGLNTVETSPGVYSTQALSISVAVGPENVTAAAWTNGTSVATAVGTGSSFFLGPQTGRDFETIVCIPVACPPPG